MTPTLPSWDTLRLVLPEIWLTIGMCAVLLVPFVDRRNKAAVTITTLVALLLALVASVATIAGSATPIFHDSLVIDSFSQFFKVLLILFTMLVVVQWWLTNRGGVHDYDAPDFLCLLLGATLGMSLMASASNLLMILVAMETASFPSFALAGFRKKTRVGSEGSLKYVIFGAAASAVSIYGMSLIYGTTGSLSLGVIAQTAAAAGGMSPLLAVGVMLLLAGIAFKLSAVPLHFWCPDVFEGAPTEVTTFLSVASKGAAVCLLVRLLGFFGATTGDFDGLAVGVGLVGAATATWGNLLAYHQSNFKRLLAYSSIGHAGYMIMAAAVIAGADSGSAVLVTDVTTAILFYLLVYMFMNLGAFTVVAYIAKRDGTEDVDGYAGLLKRSPVTAVLLSVFLLSLFGMPGLGGFWGKVYLGVAMSKAGLGGLMLIVALVLNTLISLYYYIRPIYVMSMREDTLKRPAFTPRGAVMGLLVTCGIAVFATGINLFSIADLPADFSTLNTTPAASIEPAPAPPEAPPTPEAPGPDQATTTSTTPAAGPIAASQND